MNRIFRLKKWARSEKRGSKTLAETLRVTGLLTLILILIIPFSLAGCSSSKTDVSASEILAGSTETSGQNNLALVQQNKGFSVRFYALMTFNISNQDFPYPTEFKLQPIAISWMGPTFTGNVQTKGAGAAIYSVHGSISADGNWLETLSYSINTFQPKSQFGTFCRITLRNMPLTMVSRGTLSAPTFEMSGSEVQKYVAKIEYTGSNQYISTDWQIQDPGLLPTLKLEFIKDAPVQTGPPGGGM
jgi:hypothetical protein